MYLGAAGAPSCRGAESIMLEGITTTLDGDYDELIERFFDEEWSDGLHVVLPTEGRVAAMLDDREPGKIFGPVPPMGGLATVGIGAQRPSG
jgi:hypothetical protein